MPAFAEMALGRLSLSGRWVVRIEDDAEGRAALDDRGGVLGGLLAVLVVGEQLLALVDRHHHRMQAEIAPGRQFGCDLELGCLVAGQAVDDLGAPVQLGVHLGERGDAGGLGGVGGALGVVVGHLLQRR